MMSLQNLNISKVAIIFLIFYILFGYVQCGCNNHPIFCSQEILTAVANSNYFKDSKQFVDSTLKVPIKEALDAFKNKPIEQFLNDCFGDPDLILQNIDLPDYKKYPQPLKNIKSSNYQTFALDMNLRWNQLAKKVNLNVKNSTCKGAQCTSFIPQMHGKTIIIPGGRFRQAYYWDTYWIIKGLLVCQLFDTAQQLINNFLTVVSKYGFVPNGFRLYYLNRSQPPFLSLMVKDLADKLRQYQRYSKADQLQKAVYPILISQHTYWMNSHAERIFINGKQFMVNKYEVNNDSPRPESFRQDIQMSKNLSLNQKKRLFKQLATIAQSGWDFSSRWFKDSQNMLSAQITNIIPSDLNSILGMVQQYLSFLSNKFQEVDKKQYFDDLIIMRKSYFQQIKKQEYYPDYYKTNPKVSRDLYPTDLFPHIFLGTKLSINPYKQLINPASSSTQNGQQWDYPNVWAPNSWILHQVLKNDDQKFKTAQQWVKTTYCSWKKQYAIYEKYRSDAWGIRGQGGQYQVQTGFGWSNGLALYYLSIYGKYFNDPICP